VLAHLGSGREATVEWFGGREDYRVADGRTVVLAADPARVVLEVDGVRVVHDVVISGDRVHVDSARGSASYRAVPRFVDPSEQVSPGSLLAPMPGTVIGVPLESGAAVSAGDTLIVLEAMKMQHSIKSPADGVVDVAVQVGQQVSAGDVLAVVSTGSTNGDDEGEEG